MNQEQPLFDILVNSGVALDEIVSEWLEDYKNDESLFMLLQFMVQASTNIAIEEKAAGNYVDQDELVEFFDEFNTDHTSDYPLASTKKQFKKARRIFIDFWNRWIQSTHIQLLYTEEPDNGRDRTGAEVMEWIKSLIFTMSSSAFRPFRHTATLAALTITSSLCVLANNQEQETVKISQQIETFRSKAGNHQAKLDTLEAQFRTITTKKEILDNQIMDFVNGVFIHRYRDVDPNIRKDCIQELGSWISKYPALFMESTFLRYLGWMLSDKSHLVRSSAVSAFGDVLGHGEINNKLRHFSERFKPRIIEIALREVDHNIRNEVVKRILPLLNKHGILDEEDKKRLCPLLFDSSFSEVRFLIADVLVAMFIETDLVEVMVEGSTAVETQRICLKALSRWFISILEIDNQGTTEQEQKQIEGSGHTLYSIEKDYQKSSSVSRMRLGIANAVDAIVYSLRTARSPSLSGEFRKLRKSLEDSLHEWSTIMEYLLTNDEELGADICLTDYERAILLLILIQRIKHDVSMTFNSTAANVLFETTLLPNAGPPFIQVNPMWNPAFTKSESDELAERRRSFLRIFSKSLKALVLKYGNMAITEERNLIDEDRYTLSDLSPEISALAVLEIVFMSMVGFVDVSAVSGTDKNPFTESLNYWKDAGSEENFEECLRSIIEHIFMKHRFNTVLNCTSRVLYGRWNHGTASLSLLTANQSNSLVAIIDSKLIDLYQRVYETLFLEDASNMHISNGDSDVMESRIIWFNRLETILRQRSNELCLLKNGKISKNCEADLICFDDLSHIFEIIAEKSDFGIEMSNYKTSENSSENYNIEEEFRSSLIEEDVLESGVRTEKELYSEWLHLIISAMFSNLVWRAQKPDERLFEDIVTFFSCSAGILAAGRNLAYTVAIQSLEDAKSAVKNLKGGANDSFANLTFRSHSGARKSSREESVEIAAIAEELCFSRISKNNFISKLLMGCESSNNEGLFSMISDLTLLYDMHGAADREDKSSDLLKHIVLSQTRLMRNLFNSSWMNFIANVDGGIVSSDQLVFDSEQDSNNQILIKRNILRDSIQTTIKIDEGEWDDNSMWNVIRNRFFSSFDRTSYWPAVQKLFMVSARTAWYLIRKLGPSNTEAQSIMSSISSLFGVCNSWIDELAKCVIEQLKDLAIQDPLNFSEYFASVCGASMKKALLLNGKTVVLDKSEDTDDQFKISASMLRSNMTGLLKAILAIVKENSEKTDQSRVLMEIHRQIFEQLIAGPLTECNVSNVSSDVIDMIDEIISFVFKLLTILAGTAARGGSLTVSDAKVLKVSLQKRVDEDLVAEFSCISNTAEAWREDYQKYLRAIAVLAQENHEDHLLGNLPKMKQKKRKAAKSEHALTKAALVGDISSDAESEPSVKEPLSKRKPPTAVRKLPSRTVKRFTSLEEAESDDGFPSSPEIKRVRRL